MCFDLVHSIVGPAIDWGRAVAALFREIWESFLEGESKQLDIDEVTCPHCKNKQEMTDNKCSNYIDYIPSTSSNCHERLVHSGCKTSQRQAGVFHFPHFIEKHK